MRVGFWRLRRLYQALGVSPTVTLQPCMYLLTAQDSARLGAIGLPAVSARS